MMMLLPPLMLWDFDNHNACPFQDGYGLLLALDEWLSAYIDQHAAENMVVWLSSISWPDSVITLVQDQFDKVFCMEETLTIDAANNAPLTRWPTN